MRCTGSKTGAKSNYNPVQMPRFPLVKQEVPEGVDTGDSSHGGKEVEETSNMPRRRFGGGRVHGASGRIIDSHRQEAQHPAELDVPPEASATIQMPKRR
jgi:hypothetical protein